jgi:hypothetical protein
MEVPPRMTHAVTTAVSGATTVRKNGGQLGPAGGGDDGDQHRQRDEGGNRDALPWRRRERWPGERQPT